MTRRCRLCGSSVAPSLPSCSRCGSLSIVEEHPPTSHVFRRKLQQHFPALAELTATAAAGVAGRHRMYFELRVTDDSVFAWDETFPFERHDDKHAMVVDERDLCLLVEGAVRAGAATWAGRGLGDPTVGRECALRVDAVIQTLLVLDTHAAVVGAGVIDELRHVLALLGGVPRD